MNLLPIFTTFNHVKYYDEPHKYYIGEKQLTSCTTLLKNYYEEFDAPAQAAKSSAKYGEPVQYYIDLWDHERNSAAIKGSNFHDFADHYTHNRIFPYDVSDHLKNHLYDFYNKFIKTSVMIRTEMVMGCEELMLGGMIDMLAYNRKDKYFYIVDYKTNKKIGRTGFKGKTMYEPISHLQDCEYTKYCLQTTIYRKIFEKYTGIPIKFSVLIYVNEKNKTYEPILCDYLEKEVDLIFADRLNELKVN